MLDGRCFAVTRPVVGLALRAHLLRFGNRSRSFCRANGDRGAGPRERAVVWQGEIRGVRGITLSRTGRVGGTGGINPLDAMP